MTFAAAQDEVRERFMETLALFNDIRLHSPEGTAPLDSVQKARRGLWLVSLYAAFERGTNAIVEAAISEIASHEPKSVDCAASVQSIFHYSKVQAVKDCGLNAVFDKSKILLAAAFSDVALANLDNPLADRLQNVDASTIMWITGLFGLNSFTISPPDQGRLGTLRERRNAVAHGREAASQVGERYMIGEMNNLYNAADRVITTFLFSMRDHCTMRHYLRAA